MTNCCSSYLRMAKRESLAHTVLHAALVTLLALMLPLLLATSACALSDSNAEMRELAPAKKVAKAPTENKDARQALPVKATAGKKGAAAHG